jgi:hypothetical protein
VESPENGAPCYLGGPRSSSVGFLDFLFGTVWSDRRATDADVNLLPPPPRTHKRQ